MTAAEVPSDFSSNFHEEESEKAVDMTSDSAGDSLNHLYSKSEGDNVEEKSIADNYTELPGKTTPENSTETEDCDIASGEKLSENKSEDEWLDIMGSGNFKKKIIKPGSGQDTRPNRGDFVVVDFSCFANGELFEEKKDFKFIVGDLDVIQGMDLVVCLMEKGEKAKVKIPSKLAYGTIGLLPHVPPDCDLECDIEIKDVEPVDEEALTVSQRLKLGDEKRFRGNFFYDRAQYIDAIHCYERASVYLDGVKDGSDSSPEQLQEIVDMRLKVYNNMAASHLKLDAYKAALKSVDAVLRIQPKNVKALFRKGKILGIQGSTDEAIVCMKTAAKLDPETKVIQVELTKLRNRRKKEEETQKAMYQRMFRSESKSPKPVSRLKKWSVIGCGVLAVAVGTVVAYKQMHL